MATNTWPNLRAIEALRATIVTGTTTAAGQRLGISQPAVSRLLGQLEARMGRTLFERRGGRLLPTAEGLALNSELDPLFEGLARLTEGRWAQPAGGSLRVVAPPTLGGGFLQQALAEFAGVHADLRVYLEIASSDQVIAQVSEGRADIGLTDLKMLHDRINLVPFRRARAHVVLPNDHPLSNRTVLTPSDVADQPFVALTVRHSVAQIVEQRFAEAGVARRVVAETTTSVSACAFVRAGMGIAIMNPFPVIRYDWVARHLVFVPLEPAIDYLTSIVLPTRTAPAPSRRRFVEFLRQTLPSDAWSDRA
jgi:DNA-binding transcriptional LysR family regulator